MIYWNTKITLCKYQRQRTRNKISKTKIDNETKVVAGASLSR